MVVVIYFGGRGILWANFDDYRTGSWEYMHQFHCHFFLPRKAHVLHPFYGKYFCVLRSNVNLFLPFIL